MRLILRHGMAWETAGMEALYLDRENHLAEYLYEGKAWTQLSFSAGEGFAEKTSAHRMGFYQREKVYVVFRGEGET